MRRGFERVSKLWIVTGLLFGGVMLYVAGRQVDAAALSKVLGEVDPGYVALALVAAVSFLYVKAWRWSLLLSPLRRVGALALAPAVCVGTAANLIVPHAGEFTRVLMVNDRQSLPTSALLASIAVERLFDFGAVLTFLGLMLLAQSQMPQVLISASIVAGAMFLVLLGASAFAVYRASMALRCLGVLLGPLPQRWRASLLEYAAGGIAGLTSLRQAHVLMKVSLVSLLMWLTILVIIFASIHAVGAGGPLAAVVAVLVLMVAGLTLPAAPVYVGTTQMAFGLGLAPFGVGSAQSLGASLVYTLFGLLPMLAIGGGYFLLHRSGKRAAASTR